MQILFLHHQVLLFSFVGFLALSISDQGALSRADEVLPIELISFICGKRIAAMMD